MKLTLKSWHQKYFLFSNDIFKMSLVASLISFLFLFLHLHFHPKKIDFVLSIIGLFLISLIFVQMTQDSLKRKLKYGFFISLGSAVTTTLGASLSGHLGAQNLLLIFCALCATIAFCAHTLFFTATVYIFALFVIGSGFHSPSFLVSLRFGISVLVGGGTMTASAFLFHRLNVLPIPFLKRRTLSLTFPKNFFSGKFHISYFIELSLLLILANTLAHSLQLLDGYWLPMTILFVFRPDTEFVLKRIRHRFWGTFLGSFVGFPLCFIHNPYLLALCMIPVIFFIVISVAKHYGAYVFFLTAMVSILMNIASTNGVLNMEFRVLNTSLALALVGIVMWLNKKSHIALEK